MAERSKQGAGILERELRVYEARRAEFLQHHAGKFVLIKGEEFVGAYDTQEAAYSAGVQRFGNEPMFIRLVAHEDRVEFLPALMHGVLVGHP